MIISFQNGIVATGGDSCIGQVCLVQSLDVHSYSPKSLRSKFGRDDSKHYELTVYKPIEPMLQEGPQ